MLHEIDLYRYYESGIPKTERGPTNRGQRGARFPLNWTGVKYWKKYKQIRVAKERGGGFKRDETMRPQHFFYLDSLKPMVTNAKYESVTRGVDPANL